MKKEKKLLMHSIIIMIMLCLTVSCSDDDFDPIPDQTDIVFGTVDDVGGNTYRTVIIGNQEWFAENLRTVKFNDGTDIADELPEPPEGEEDVDHDYYAVYFIHPHDEVDGLDSDDDVVEAYGLLYNWFAVNSEKGLCPDGWRVPSDEDWNDLIMHLEDVYGIENTNTAEGAGNYLKAAIQVDHPWGGDHDVDTLHHPRWNLNEFHYGMDAFGFSALPGNSVFKDNDYTDLGSHGYWWSSSEYSESTAWSYYILNYNGTVGSGYRDKYHGYSVRCVR